MRWQQSLTVLVAALFLGTSAAEARRTSCWSLADLQAKSQLVCEGTVISVKQTGAAKSFSYCEGAMVISEVIMVAKIKMVRILKGSASTEIEFRYRITEPPTVVSKKGGVILMMGHAVADGPQHIALEQGKDYRLFLAPDRVNGGYVNVLEGDADDFQAVKAL